MDSTFTNAQDMARTLYPFIPSFLFSSSFDSLNKIKNIDEPKLLIHSTNDEIVPFSLGRKLFLQAKKPKEFLEIKGSHNTNFIDSQEKYISGIESFIESIKF